MNQHEMVKGFAVAIIIASVVFGLVFGISMYCQAVTEVSHKLGVSWFTAMLMLGR